MNAAKRWAAEIAEKHATAVQYPTRQQSNCLKLFPYQSPHPLKSVWPPATLELRPSGVDKGSYSSGFFPAVWSAAKKNCAPGMLRCPFTVALMAV